MSKKDRRANLEKWIAEPGRGFVEDLGCNLYSKTEVIELAQRHSINGVEQIALLWEKLELHGYEYQSIFGNQRTTIRPSEYKRWLNRVKNKAKNLRELISYENDGLGRSYLEMGSDELQRSIYRNENRTRFSKSELESVSDKGIVPPALEKIEQYLTYLEYAVVHTIDILPNSGKGPKEAEPLKRWINEFFEYWTEELGRNATVDAEDGALLTPYGVFMSDCIRPLDPSVLESGSRPNLASQLRKHLSSRKNAKSAK